MSEHRKVLLLGNGINRAFGENSWKVFLDTLSDRGKTIDDDSRTPMPLKAIIITDDNIKGAMQKHPGIMRGEIKSEEHMKMLQSLLALGFDDILTTNYSYEIELAAAGCSKMTDKQIQKLMRHTGHGRAEAKYLLHTYNEIAFNGKTTRVWHIHGESRKPDSMMIGYYWYGQLLFKIQAALEANKNDYSFKQNLGATINYDSWVDSFILGDLYILGHGLDLSEFDLWWLFNRRKRENARKGKALFYGPDENDKDKLALLDLFGVDTDKRLGYGGQSVTGEKEIDYKAYYTDAIKDIKLEINKSK